MAEQKSGWNYFFTALAAFSLIPIVAQLVSQNFNNLLQEHRFQLWFWVIQLGLVAITAIAAIHFLGKYFKPVDKKNQIGFASRKTSTQQSKNRRDLLAGLLCLTCSLVILARFCTTVGPTLYHSGNDKKIQLSANPIEVVFGAATNLDYSVEGSVGGIPAGYHVAWEVAPDVGNAFDPESMRFTPASTIPDGDTIQFKVILRNGLGVDVSEDSVTVLVRHSAKYKLDPGATKLYPNETATIQVKTTDGTPIDPKLRFEWTRSDESGLIGENSDQIQFVVNEAGQIIVTVTIRNPNEEVIGTFRTTVEVRDSLSHTSMVLDASLRMTMNRDSGESLLDVAKMELSQQVKFSELFGGYVGLTVFGDSHAADHPEPCQHLSQHPVKRDYSRLRVSLDKTQAGVKEAPLIFAIQNASKELQRAAKSDSKKKLIVVSGGPDNCAVGEDLESFLQQIENELEIDVNFEIRYPKFIVMFCPNENDYRRWTKLIASQQNSERGPLIFPTQKFDEFRTLIQSTVSLEARSQDTRDQAFETLKTFASETMKDNRGVNLLSRYEESVSD